jgi:hypothetical protein
MSSVPLHAWPSGQACSGPQKYEPGTTSGVHAAALIAIASNVARI